MMMYSSNDMYLTPPSTPPQSGKCSPVSYEMGSFMEDYDFKCLDDISYNDMSAILARALTPPPDSMAELNLAASFNLEQPEYSESRYTPIEGTFRHVECNPAISGGLEFSYPYSLDMFYDMSMTQQQPQQLQHNGFQQPQQRRKYKVGKIKSPKREVRMSPVSVSSAEATAESQSDKRDSHNVLERQRRGELKNSFTKLRHTVGTTSNTGTILSEAIICIREEREKEKVLVREVERLRILNAHLQQNLCLSFIQ